MTKFVLFMSFVCLSFLMIGSLIAPNSAMMWLASSTQTVNLLRVLLILVLIALFVTDPPRHVAFRAIVGLMAITFLLGTIYYTYDNKMQLLDTLSFAAVSVSMGLAALEYNFEEKPISFARSQDELFGQTS